MQNIKIETNKFQIHGTVINYTTNQSGLVSIVLRNNDDEGRECPALLWVAKDQRHKRVVNKDTYRFTCSVVPAFRDFKIITTDWKARDE